MESTQCYFWFSLWSKAVGTISAVLSTCLESLKIRKTGLFQLGDKEILNLFKSIKKRDKPGLQRKGQGHILKYSDQNLISMTLFFERETL